MLEYVAIGTLICGIRATKDVYGWYLIIEWFAKVGPLVNGLGGEWLCFERAAIGSG